LGKINTKRKKMPKTTTVFATFFGGVFVKSFFRKEEVFFTVE